MHDDAPTDQPSDPHESASGGDDTSDADQPMRFRAVQPDRQPDRSDGSDESTDPATTSPEGHDPQAEATLETGPALDSGPSADPESMPGTSPSRDVASGPAPKPASDPESDTESDTEFDTEFGPAPATDLIENMWAGLGKPLPINTANGGAVPNMADDAFLELLCEVDMNGPRPLPYPEMPRGIRGLCEQVLDTHELTAAAAFLRRL